MSNTVIVLNDRIKELSHSTGTGPLALDGPAPGFGAFGSAYNYNDILFYGVTDGTNFEVGSGMYYQNGSTNTLMRFPNPFASSVSGNLPVNFPNGIKEVYVTYPGKTAIFSANGMGNVQGPKASGVGFFASPQIINYDPNFVFDSGRHAIGLTNPAPQYAIDIGGSPAYSMVHSSGLWTGISGVMFSGAPGYSGGQQFEPFMRNIADVTTGAAAIVMYSGLVNQSLTLLKQSAGLVFAGPPSGCTPPNTCTPAYPTFRQLAALDIPDLSSTYGTIAYISGVTNAISGWAGNNGALTDAAVSGWATTVANNTANAVSGYMTNVLYPTVVTEATTGRTLSVADYNHYIRTTNASGVTVTIPSGGMVPLFPNGEFTLEQAGSGQITITPASGVTLVASRSSFKSAGPYAVIKIKNISTDYYTMYGDRP